MHGRWRCRYNPEDVLLPHLACAACRISNSFETSLAAGITFAAAGGHRLKSGRIFLDACEALDGVPMVHGRTVYGGPRHDLHDVFCDWLPVDSRVFSTSTVDASDNAATNIPYWRVPDETNPALTARLDQIKKLTDELLRVQDSCKEARHLAERIQREVEATRTALHIPKTAL